ncbi:Fe-S cluster assembly protein SufB, partial [Candidatus Parvarchaeota archaeon]|nr:Fe-S cluster assembly protein SufB [Candidatus Parvarchaeota archaeon]
MAALKIEREDAQAAPEKYSPQANPVRAIFETKKGLNEETIREISRQKGEPDWMLQHRLHSLKVFNSKPIPTWGPDLSGLNLNEITHYVKPESAGSKSWKDVPDYIKNTFDKLGIPEAERNFLSGVGAMYESEVVYKGIKKNL